MTEKPLPFKPKDWVAEEGTHARIGQVKDVYRVGDEVLLDLIMFELSGVKLGRTSPAIGGPRTFEPACSAEGWERISEPAFPIPLKWVPTENGEVVARYVAGTRLPPASYVRRHKSGKKALQNANLKRALEAIADGHNDPRQLATEVLGIRNPKTTDS